MTETLAHGDSSESTLQELSNEYHHDRVYMFFKDLCIHLLWIKVALALQGLKGWFQAPFTEIVTGSYCAN